MVSSAFFFFVPRVVAWFAATSTLVYADDFAGLYFDLNSLIWMLIGALGWAVILFLLDKRPGHRINPAPIVAPRTVAEKPVGRAEEAESRKDAPNENFSEYLTSLDEDTTVTVEELSGITEQIDLFLLLGRHEVAISMLLSRIETENESDPRIWFKLLDIYHARGDRVSFEKLASDIRRRFNVALPTWEDSTLQSEGRYGLEHFPHLLDKISDCWGTSSSLGYLQSLIKDNRSGERSGFSEDAFRDVMFLIGILEQTTDQPTALH